MTKTGTDVLNTFAQSLAGGTSEWKEVLSDDITFKGPVDQVSGKEAFIQLNEGFFPMVQDAELLRRAEQNGLVASEMVYKLKTPSGDLLTIAMTELAQVTEGKIQSIDVYYDAEAFRKAFGMT